MHRQKLGVAKAPGCTVALSGAFVVEGTQLNVLWLTREVPYPQNSGDRIYVSNTIESLARAGLHVTAIACHNPAGSLPNASASRVNWLYVPAAKSAEMRFLTSVRYPLAAYRSMTASYKDVLKQQLTKPWDAIVIDHVGMVWALDFIRALKPAQKFVYFSHNFETAVAKDLARNFKGNLLRKLALTENSRRTADAERKLLKACQTVSTITEEDSASYRGIATAPRYVVVTPGYEGPRAAPRQITPRTPRQVLMLGSFDWLPKQLNLEKFVQAAGDRFQQNDIALNIVGSVPDKLKQRLSASSKAIHFLGYVDDLNAIYRDSRMALVFEETGGGFKLKLLDYIFNRLPVFGITSAVAGLPDTIMRQIFLAADMQGLVDLIIENIDQYEKLNASQESAFAVAEQTFDWDVSVSKLVEALAAESSAAESSAAESSAAAART